MKEFVFSYPTKVYFGEGSMEKALAAECGRYGKTVMLAYGGASLKKNGIYDRVKKLLTPIFHKTANELIRIFSLLIAC